MARLSFGRAWAGSQRGNVALMFAVMLPMVIGGAGLGLETTYWYLTRLNLQTAADAAAYSAAMDLRTGSDEPAIITTATDTAVANGFDAAAGDIQVNTPPLTGAGGTQAVEVILEAEATRFFTALFSNGPVPVRARAVASWANAGNACVLALSGTASKAALFSGAGNTSLSGCSVMSNSNASDAITVQGSAKLNTECLVSGGGVSVNSGLTMECAKAVTKASPVADPLRDLPVPSGAGACLSDVGAVLEPGRYCSGMDLKTAVTLNPGVYYVTGGDFKLSALANVVGEGVTIYLDSGSNISMNGAATVSLSAPTSGTYSGMLFFGDRAGTGNNTFNGTASSSLTGTIYFKSGKVNYLGNISGAGGCTQVVADTVNWSGTSSISQDCASKGMTPITAITVVTLTE